jgi:type I restriction enzyme S subunit
MISVRGILSHGGLRKGNPGSQVMTGFYRSPGIAVPFLTAKELFFFRPDRERFISRRMPKLHELQLPEGCMLLSRSGITGHPVLVSKWLTQFAVTDDAIRILPGSSPIGFIYTFLASSIGRPLMVKSEYGATVSHIEARHIATIPIPLIPEHIQQTLHEKVIKVYALRDEANELLDRAETDLHALLGISPFTEDDIEYFGEENSPRAFTVSSNDLGMRFDATNHIPLVKSVIHKLEKSRFALVPLSELCSEVSIPPRFKRNYVEVNKGVPYLLPSYLAVVRPYKMKYLSERQAKTSPEYLLEEGKLLVTTDGTVGRVHPITRRMVGWFGSNNMARLWDNQTDMGFLYAFLTTPFGLHQIRKDIYGGVVDHESIPLLIYGPKCESWREPGMPRNMR